MVPEERATPVPLPRSLSAPHSESSGAGLSLLIAATAFEDMSLCYRSAGLARTSGAVRSSASWITVQGWRPAWSKAPLARQLQALSNSVSASRGLHL